MRRPQRRQPSSVDRLDPEIKDLIGKLRIDHGWTIDEILKRLRSIGQGAETISRSALGRHVKSIEEIGAEIRESRDMALALRAATGADSDDRTAELNIELLQTSILRLVTRQRDDEDDKENAGEVKALATALRDLASARKTIQEAVRKARDAAKAEAAAAVEKVAKKVQGGLTRDTVDAIKREILGVG